MGRSDPRFYALVRNHGVKRLVRLTRESLYKPYHAIPGLQRTSAQIMWPGAPCNGMVRLIVEQVYRPICRPISPCFFYMLFMSTVRARQMKVIERNHIHYMIIKAF